MPYQGYGTIYLREFANNSNYHAALLQFQHRLQHGVTVGANYTYSKALDCSDSYSTAVDPILDPRSRNYGPAGFNRSSVFSGTFYYRLPKPGQAMHNRPVGWVADNWELSGVTRMMTGTPVTPGYSLITGLNQPSGTPSESARMEVINPTAPMASRFGPPPEPAGQTTAANAAWLSTSPLPQFGNLGQNTLTLPGTNNWDVSVYRNIIIKERFTTMLRLETYNTFNHSQFSNVNSTAQFNTKGQQVNTAFLLPSSARPARIVQVALRVFF